MMCPSPYDRDGLDQVRSVTRQYYTAKVKKHGATPRGVDWSCVATQELRFVQLLKIRNKAARFSLNDVGCGYGAILTYLAQRHATAAIDYLGFDLSSTMIAHAKRLYGNWANTIFVVAHSSPRAADYSVASGIFNIKLNLPIRVWERFVASTLQDMHAASRKGFAVNFIAPGVGVNSSALLYRTPAKPWVRFCEHTLGCATDVISDYGLREFTLLVRRQSRP